MPLEDYCLIRFGDFKMLFTGTHAYTRVIFMFVESGGISTNIEFTVP